MRYLFILVALSVFSSTKAQNFQNYNYMQMHNTNDDIDSLFKYKVMLMNQNNNIDSMLTEFQKHLNIKQSSTNQSEIEKGKKEIRDSILFVNAKIKVVDLLSSRKNTIRQNIRKVDILEAAWLKMNNLNHKLSSQMFADIQEMKRSLLDADSETIKFIKRLDTLKLTNTKFFQNFKDNETFTFDDKKFKEIQSSLNNAYSEYTKSNAESTTAASIPQISTINNKFNPTISLLGAAEFNKNGKYKLEVFIGNGTIDTVNITTVLVPELSKYGIRLNGFKELNKRIGVNGDLHFHEKKSFNPKENTDFNFSRIQAKVGLEGLIFENILSFYANYNYIIPITNAEKYKELFAPIKQDLGYLDLGIKLFLSPKGELAKNTGVGLFIDLNFISTTEAIKVLNKSSDDFIPNIKFGLQKNFR